MAILSQRGTFILSSSCRGEACRGILELAARFGCVSMREVRYGFGLTLRQEIDGFRQPLGEAQQNSGHH